MSKNAEIVVIYPKTITGNLANPVKGKKDTQGITKFTFQDAEHAILVRPEAVFHDWRKRPSCIWREGEGEAFPINQYKPTVAECTEGHPVPIDSLRIEGDVVHPETNRPISVKHIVPIQGYESAVTDIEMDHVAQNTFVKDVKDKTRNRQESLQKIANWVMIALVVVMAIGFFVLADKTNQISETIQNSLLYPTPTPTGR